MSISNIPPLAQVNLADCLQVARAGTAAPPKKAKATEVEHNTPNEEPKEISLGEVNCQAVTTGDSMNSFRWR